MVLLLHVVTEVTFAFFFSNLGSFFFFILVVSSIEYFPEYRYRVEKFSIVTTLSGYHLTALYLQTSSWFGFDFPKLVTLQCGHVITNSTLLLCSHSWVPEVCFAATELFSLVSANKWQFRSISQSVGRNNKCQNPIKALWSIWVGQVILIVHMENLLSL